jgi:hypothetical protein
MNTERQTGRTTRQMQHAPIDAVFVWCNSDLYYPKKLAQALGRNDLQIKPRSFIRSKAWMGLCRAVVVDHALPYATPLTLEEEALLNELLKINAIYHPASTHKSTKGNPPCDLCKENGGYYYGRTGFEPCCI